MSAARKIVRLAIGDSAILPAGETYQVSRFLVQNERMSDDLPFGSRGGFAVSHYFPLEGEYIIKVRLLRSGKDDIIGFDRPQQLDLRVDEERVKLFLLSPEARLQEQAGKYELDDHLEVRVTAQAGTHRVLATFLRETVKSEGVLRRQRGLPQNGPGVGSITIDGPYNSKGPGETPSRQRIFICRPSGSAAAGEITPVSLPLQNQTLETCAARILSALARRAFRRPVSPGEVSDLLNLFRDGRSS